MVTGAHRSSKNPCCPAATATQPHPLNPQKNGFTPPVEEKTNNKSSQNEFSG
jgi:hypothetical protein